MFTSIRYIIVRAGQQTGHNQSIQLDGGALEEACINTTNFRGADDDFVLFVVAVE